MLCGIAFFSWRRKPEYGFALLWFFISLWRASGILVPTHGLLYEHWLYFASVGFFLFIGVAVSDVLNRFNLRFSLICLTGAMAFVAFLSFQTIRRNAVWRDPITFYNDVIAYNQKSLRVWNNLGMAYSDQKEYPKAVSAYQKAIALDTKERSAPPYHNLGNAYQAMGTIDKAIQAYEQAITRDKHFLFSYNALTGLYLKQKRYQDALATLERAAKNVPDNEFVRSNISFLKEAMAKDSLVVRRVFLG